MPARKTPWYLTPATLLILRRVLDSPPQRVFERDTNSRNYHDGRAGYRSYDVIALRSAHAKAFKAVYDARPFNQAAADTVLESSPDELLAGVFGCPDNLDWAHPERAERRAGFANAIRAALATKVAA